MVLCANVHLVCALRQIENTLGQWSSVFAHRSLHDQTNRRRRAPSCIMTTMLKITRISSRTGTVALGKLRFQLYVVAAIEHTCDAKSCSSLADRKLQLEGGVCEETSWWKLFRKGAGVGGDGLGRLWSVSVREIVTRI